MPDQTVTCSFPDVESGDANILAEDFADSIIEDVSDASIRRVRDDELSQDFGASLVLILGTPAVLALASGVSKWLARRSEARIQLRRVDAKGKEREVTVDGQIGHRAEAVIREFFEE